MAGAGTGKTTVITSRTAYFDKLGIYQIGGECGCIYSNLGTGNTYIQWNLCILPAKTHILYSGVYKMTGYFV